MGKKTSSLPDATALHATTLVLCGPTQTYNHTPNSGTVWCKFCVLKQRNGGKSVARENHNDRGCNSLVSFSTLLTCALAHFLQVQKTDRLACAESELALCEAEVGTLLQIISELNLKMSALKIPRDKKDYEKQIQTSKSVSDSILHPLAPQSSLVANAGTASVESVTRQYSAEYEGRWCSADLWTKLQQVLSSLESSAVRGRKLVAPYVQNDEKAHEKHLTAARDTWVQATECKISFISKRYISQVLEEIEQELGISYPSALPTKERQKYQKEVIALGKLNRQLSLSLRKRQEEQKKMKAAILEMKEEKKRLREKLEELQNKWLITASCSPPRSPSLSFNRTPSPCWSSSSIPPSPLLSRRMPISPPGSPSRPPRPSSGCSVLETETARLQRSMERLKARNERLTAALEKRKSESEQISMSLSRHEADCSALHMALTYCLSAEEIKNKIGVIQQRITRLKQERAAVCVPQETRTGEGKLSPDTGTLAGARRLSFLSSNNPNEEKTALLQELVNVRGEMSELRELIRLKEKEWRFLEFSLVAHRCQDLAGAAMAQSLREELEGKRAENQRIEEYQAKLESGALIPQPRNQAIMRELQAALQRTQMLKRKETSLRELLDAEMLDCTTQTRVNKEEVARLSFYHNKAISACRNARKKHHEQLRRIERQMTAMALRHECQLAELKTMLEELEKKKEETML
ncbi:Usher syndrome type-1C protein-binding protein 1 [Bagarius yarrelli]|uniref:Usher syndrome type-1C protein-binding protein 1 n=1 Tax=Bagarius yarrelli TaxID=175774 RepID=A0A556U5P1_BAGYA|nr:Usher syndrome type-1C protein-binding protein 1 [Bagarius yarrelli]